MYVDLGTVAYWMEDSCSGLRGSLANLDEYDNVEPGADRKTVSSMKRLYIAIADNARITKSSLCFPEDMPQLFVSASYLCHLRPVLPSWYPDWVSAAASTPEGRCVCLANKISQTGLRAFSANDCESVILKSAACVGEG